MTPLILHRTDPTRNMQRFYLLEVQRDLFGQWCFIREWGRIGQPGQVRGVPFPTEREAHAALDRQRRAKQRRGYATERQERSAPMTRATLGAGEPERVTCKQAPPYPFRLS
jgi:predicted DNA-binding WGR domain protein